MLRAADCYSCCYCRHRCHDDLEELILYLYNLYLVFCVGFTSSVLNLLLVYIVYSVFFSSLSCIRSLLSIKLITHILFHSRFPSIDNLHISHWLQECQVNPCTRFKTVKDRWSPTNIILIYMKRTHTKKHILLVVIINDDFGLNRLDFCVSPNSYTFGNA